MRLKYSAEDQNRKPIDSRIKVVLGDHELAYIDACYDMLLYFDRDNRNPDRRHLLLTLTDVMREVSMEAAYEARLN